MPIGHSVYLRLKKDGVESDLTLHGVRARNSQEARLRVLSAVKKHPKLKDHQITKIKCNSPHSLQYGDGMAKGISMNKKLLIIKAQKFDSKTDPYLEDIHYPEDKAHYIKLQESGKKNEAMALYHRQKAYFHNRMLNPKFGSNEETKKQHKEMSDHHNKKADEFEKKSKPSKKITIKKKEGEGSRGGKVIGHTKSGKAIYEAHHESHEKFSRDDHLDAHDLHSVLANAHRKIHESIDEQAFKLPKDIGQDKTDELFDASMSHAGKARDHEMQAKLHLIKVKSKEK